MNETIPPYPNTSSWSGKQLYIFYFCCLKNFYSNNIERTKLCWRSTYEWKWIFIYLTANANDRITEQGNKDKREVGFCLLLVVFPVTIYETSMQNLKMTHNKHSDISKTVPVNF
jgi:hypothetical protein